MSRLILPKSNAARVDACRIVGLSFGKVGPRGELGMSVVLEDEQRKHYQLARTLKTEDFHNIKGVLERLLAGYVNDVTGSSGKQNAI